MGRIRIVTDSVARYAQPELLTRYPVTIVPMHVDVGGRLVEDTPGQEPWEVLPVGDGALGLPRLVAPSVDTMTNVYAQLLRETDQILSIHSTARVSAAVTNATLASQNFRGRCEIQVVDSQSLSVGQGLLVEAAAEAAARGESYDEVVRIVRGMIPRLYMVFFLQDLAYLERLGQISRSQAILGNMLGIIPFLTFEDGDVTPMEKVRSRPRAVEKLVEFVSEFAHIEHLAILHSGPQPTDESLVVAERLQALHPRMRIPLTSYGLSTAACIGPESLGVVVLEAEEEAV
jgi:DegV family protein with EDD domain